MGSGSINYQIRGGKGSLGQSWKLKSGYTLLVAICSFPHKLRNQTNPKRRSFWIRRPLPATAPLSGEQRCTASLLLRHFRGFSFPLVDYLLPRRNPTDSFDPFCFRCTGEHHWPSFFLFRPPQRLAIAIETAACPQLLSQGNMADSFIFSSCVL